MNKLYAHKKPYAPVFTNDEVKVPNVDKNLVKVAEEKESDPDIVRAWEIILEMDNEE